MGTDFLMFRKGAETFRVPQQAGDFWNRRTSNWCFCSISTKSRKIVSSEFEVLTVIVKNEE
jgi:hypothetical protein